MAPSLRLFIPIVACTGGVSVDTFTSLPVRFCPYTTMSPTAFIFYEHPQSSTDQLRRDLTRLKQQYGTSVQKAARLEQELNQAKSQMKTLESVGKGIGPDFGTLTEELCEARRQLAQKSELLDKVKLLLQRAAAKEKALQEEVSV